MRIPISDKQFLDFFKNLPAKVRAFLGPRLTSKRARIVVGCSLATVVVVLGIALRPQVSEVPLQGLILKIEAENILSEKTGIPECRVLIAVGDTVETSLLLPPPVPDIGHFVPLKKKGRGEYILDQEKWLLNGPS